MYSLEHFFPRSDRRERPRESLEKDPTNHAREIARESGFEHAYQTLKEEKRLEREVARVQELYRERLGDTESFVTKTVWEALTIIELFHPETAEHCVETYRLAREKVERHLAGSDVLLSELFGEEQVTLPVFYRACLLHDVGKVDVPVEIITNRATDADCAHLLEAHHRDPYIQTVLEKHHLQFVHDPMALIDALAITGRRPKDITPTSILVPEHAGILLRQQGIDTNLPLADLIRPHESHSAAILEALAMPEEAKLAGRHHNYLRLPVETPVTLGGLGVSISLAEILHVADIEQAMEAERSYKARATPLEAMVALAHSAERGVIHPGVVTVWIRDSIEHFYHSSEELTATLASPTERACLEYVLHFLSLHESVDLGGHQTSVHTPTLLH